MRAPLLIIAGLATSAMLAEDAPSTFTAPVPSGRFTITQQWFRPDWIKKDTDCTDADCGWEASLQFADQSKPKVTLAAAPEWYSWPADYHISPDEEWIIRDQKTGSGENALFLYHLTRDGQLWRLSTSVDDVVFAKLLGPLHRTRKDYYHLEVTLASWDLPAGVHLKAYAVPEDKKDKLIEGQKIRYDLRTHVATPE